MATKHPDPAFQQLLDYSNALLKLDQCERAVIETSLAARDIVKGIPSGRTSPREFILAEQARIDAVDALAQARAEREKSEK